MWIYRIDFVISRGFSVRFVSHWLFCFMICERHIDWHGPCKRGSLSWSASVLPKALIATTSSVMSTANSIVSIPTFETLSRARHTRSDESDIGASVLRIQQRSASEIISEIWSGDNRFCNAFKFHLCIAVGSCNSLQLAPLLFFASNLRVQAFLMLPFTLLVIIFLCSAQTVTNRNSVLSFVFRQNAWILPKLRYIYL